MLSQFQISSYIFRKAFNYAELSKNNWLNDALSKLDNLKISDNKTSQLAYWLNMYNLLTLKSVLEKLEHDQSWSGNTSLFQKLSFFILKKHKVKGQKLSLYTIENSIIRKKFQDPRIHFALNCASKSCPIIPGFFFDENNLEKMLEDLTFEFINNQGGVELSGDTLFLSRIFKWYKKDFQAHGGVLEFIKKYLNHELPQKVRIQYIDYDWSLNT